MSKNQFESATPTGNSKEYFTNRSWGKTLTEKMWKQSKEIIWWALVWAIALFGKVYLAVCDWL